MNTYYEKKKNKQKEIERIFDKVTENNKKIEALKKKRLAWEEYFRLAYKRMDNLFDLGMAMLLIANILMYIWTQRHFQMWNIGFICGMWLASVMGRGLRRTL